MHMCEPARRYFFIVGEHTMHTTSVKTQVISFHVKCNQTLVLIGPVDGNPLGKTQLYLKLPLNVNIGIPVKIYTFM